MNTSEKTASGLRLIRREDKVGVLVFDLPGESVNTLRAEFAQDLAQILEDVDRDQELLALVVASGKKDNFIAGADISMLAAVSSPDAAAALSHVGQRALNRIVELRVPVVAAIHGACLGGGLELALACAGRVATSHEKTRLGLPEVQLGILPGMGGTQRLPQLVGLSAALDLLLTGRQLDARRSLKMGLVDEVVPEALLMQVAVARALQLAVKSHTKAAPFAALREMLDPDELRELALSENPLGRKVVFDQARKKLREKTQGNYPAPEKILQVVKLGLERGFSAGLLAEAEAFGELVVSEEAMSLRHIYFSQQSLKKDFNESMDGHIPVDRVAVLGAGLMGAGIAVVTVNNADCAVRLKDVDNEGVRRGLLTVRKSLDALVSRRRISERQKAVLSARVTGVSDPKWIGPVDVVIEAVFEDIDLKKRVLRETEEFGTNETIFASNTSSLPIATIAAAARHPERVIGMHYFSPVEKMPLLEVIATEQTAPWVVQKCVDLGRRQGKTVIVVGDGPGFYTTRILGPYLNEAAFALVEGASVEAVDADLVQSGFPLGPLALLDEVGIDVGSKVAETLKNAFGERMAPPKELTRLLEAGRQGKKNKLGFYNYRSKSSGPRAIDPTVYGDLGLEVPEEKPVRPRRWSDVGSVAERCMLIMVNEAVRCLEEGVLKRPRDGDIGAIFGLGFPPYLGGPFLFIDQVGAHNLLGRFRRLQHTHGERFAPAPLLVSYAESGTLFYPSGNKS